MNKLSLLIILLFTLEISYGQSNSNPNKALNQVIFEFKEAIKEKDSTRFGKLFFTEEIPFVGIMSEASEMSIKKDYPEFEGVAISNSQKFIHEICQTEKRQEERTYNIKIESDGVIASVNFDYSFHSGNRMIQWGNENWNLVFADQKWLITDVVYSIHFPAIEEFHFPSKQELEID